MITIGKLPCHNATVHVIDDSDGQLGRFVCVVPTVEEVKGGKQVFYNYSHIILRLINV